MSSDKSSSGIGMCGIVFCIFLFLKLAGIGIVAEWSWWWIFSPIWIPSSFYLILVIIGFLMAYFDKRRASKYGAQKLNKKK